MLDNLKQSIVSGPVLACPDPDQWFYLKTDWSKNGMGAVMLQVERTPKALEAEKLEKEGAKC